MPPPPPTTQKITDLPIFNSTTLSSPASATTTSNSSRCLLAVNPALDLTATAGDAGSVLHVWRAGDHQLVSKHVERGGGLRGRWKGWDDMFLFSTTASLESVFRTCKAEDADDVHVMVVGMADGGIHLSIYDSFVIGTLRYSPRGDGVFQLCGHSSQLEASTHMLLLRPRDGDGTALYLVPMDLNFLHHSPVNLSLLASKTTTLQNLLRYLKQTQSHMVSEWKSTRELPARFMLGVQDDLKKIGDMTVVQALYHTVVTGHVLEPVKEWLLDSLGDRGHKRWEKAVVSGLTSLRGLVHENFIPALERCGFILSRLLGIARFHDSEENIGFNEAHINKLLDIVSCLMMVAHRVLTTVMDELEHFGVFSIWLKLEIDKQTSSSSMSDDISEKEATMDHPKVMTYMQHYLVSSPLAVYFDEVAKEDYVKDQEMIEPGPSLLDLLDRQLQEQEAGRPYMKVLPRVDFLVNYLTSRANSVFKGIAEAEKQNVRFGQGTEVSIGQKIWKHDIWMSRPNKKNDFAPVFTAIVPEDDKSKIFIMQADVPLHNINASATTKSCGIALQNGTVIVDFQFLDDKSLLCLCSRTEEPKSVLLRIAYSSTHMPYQEYTPGQCPSMVGLTEAMGSYFGFSHISGFTPVQMEVQQAKNLRGEIPARVSLLGRDKAMYKTWVLPADFQSGGVKHV
ncbi:hypothetical protein N0V88_001845 [Collariella sp. IMI 366227]|nr:hypothetical protein N0V88_001845 [Collariella sp. IMI 366227]